MGEVKPKVFLNSAEEVAYDREQRRKGNRGDVLPFKETKEGIDWGLPQWVMDFYNSATLPRDTLKGVNPTQKDVTEFGLNVGAVGGGASAALAPEADLGMFLGRRAKNADTKKLAEAMSMESQGVNRNEIWNKTGWFRSVDDEWKFEVSDEGLKVNITPEEFTGVQDVMKERRTPELRLPPIPTSEVVDHKDLFDNYPASNKKVLSAIDIPPIDKPYKQKTGVPGTPSEGLKEVTPTTRIGALNPDKSVVNRSWSGSFTPSTQEIFAEGSSLDKIRSVVAHELQHAVQEREGWEPGSNEDFVKKLTKDFMDSVPKEGLVYLKAKRDETLLKNQIDTIKVKLEEVRGERPYGWSFSEDNDLTPRYGMEEDLLDQLYAKEQALKGTQDVIPFFRKVVEPILPELERVGGFLNKTFGENYKRNTGEAEARIVQKRLKGSSEDNKFIHPLDDIDVPEDETWSLKDLQAVQRKLHDFKSRAIEDEAEEGWEEGLDETVNPEQPRRYAKGGMVIDPVSGNEVPPGARPEEVRDDIDIKASEGEYIIPANVVRFLGLEKLEKIVAKAQEALGALEDTERMGGDAPDETEELPFDMGTLESIEDGPKAPTSATPIKGFAEGGLVEGGQDVQGVPGAQVKQYKDANGRVIFIPFVNGQPLFPPPDGYAENNPNAVTPSAPNPMNNVDSGNAMVDNDPNPKEKHTPSPLAGSPANWSVENFLDFGKSKGSVGEKAIKGIIGMVPGGALAMKARDKFLDSQVTQLFDTMLESGVDPLGTPITPEQRSQLLDTKTKLKKQMSDQSGLNLNPIERLTDAFTQFSKFTNPQAAQPAASGPPMSSLSPEATKMVTPQQTNKSDNQYSGGSVKVGSDLGRQNNGPSSGSMRSGGLYSKGGLVVRPNKK